MVLPKRFSDQELERIVDEATIYMCACPGQVAVQLRGLRELHRYQLRCVETPGEDSGVHGIIAESAARAHALMEDCLEEVLVVEGWDRATLKMPEGLRRRRDQELDDDLD